MINVFTSTNVNTKISVGKLSESFFSEVCIKLVVLRINRAQEGARIFTKRLVTPIYAFGDVPWRCHLKGHFCQAAIADPIKNRGPYFDVFADSIAVINTPMV